MPSRHVLGSKDIVTSRRPMSIDMIGANAAAEPVMARAMVERESMFWMKAVTNCFFLFLSQEKRGEREGERGGRI